MSQFCLKFNCQQSEILLYPLPTPNDFRKGGKVLLKELKVGNVAVKTRKKKCCICFFFISLENEHMHLNRPIISDLYSVKLTTIVIQIWAREVELITRSPLFLMMQGPFDLRKFLSNSMITYSTNEYLFSLNFPNLFLSLYSFCF